MLSTDFGKSGIRVPAVALPSKLQRRAKQKSQTLDLTSESGSYIYTFIAFCDAIRVLQK